MSPNSFFLFVLQDLREMANKRWVRVQKRTEKFCELCLIEPASKRRCNANINWNGEKSSDELCFVQKFH